MKMKKMMLALGLIAGAGMDIQAGEAAIAQQNPADEYNIAQKALYNVVEIPMGLIAQGLGLMCRGALGTVRPIMTAIFGQTANHWVYLAPAFVGGVLVVKRGGTALYNQYLQSQLIDIKAQFEETKLGKNASKNLLWNKEEGKSLKDFETVFDYNGSFDQTALDKAKELRQLVEKALWGTGLIGDGKNGARYGVNLNYEVAITLQSIKSDTSKEVLAQFFQTIESTFNGQANEYEKSWTHYAYEKLSSNLVSAGKSGLQATHDELKALYLHFVKIEMILTHIQIQKTK